MRHSDLAQCVENDRTQSSFRKTQNNNHKDGFWLEARKENIGPGGAVSGCHILLDTYEAFMSWCQETG